ncbi:hypothetical protein AMATHDRAFT_198749 [Amanita thiersii Skay4041]|uniref:Uncharacterized protein n=1 Tax=Amanita thiersii Skay4041 TaxID=703135 RepID=A0A2A9NH18_9AGAR|nr:hypothetical protein AMATHDRAFT_198749 [Amanita thiersii Skay4041]
MSIVSSIAAPLVPPPDDVTIPEFFLDGKRRHPTEPMVDREIPSLIEENTGRRIFLGEVSLPGMRTRTDHLARSLKQRWDIRDGDIVSLITPNHVDYPVCIWAVHRLRGVVAATSPTLTKDELVFTLNISKPKLIICHVDNLEVTVRAAAAIGFIEKNIIVLDGEKKSDSGTHKAVDGLVKEGGRLPGVHVQPLKPGEAKSKLAFLCFSSGTTGKPKGVCISHYNLICNVLQVATFKRVNEDYTTYDRRRHRPGDVCSGGESVIMPNSVSYLNRNAVLPLYHIYGLVVNLHFIIYAKMTLVVSQKFDFLKMLQSIKEYRMTHLMIVPPQAVLLCKHPAAANADLSSVRYCMVAGAPVTAELVKQLVERLPGVELGQGYGMTESCAAVSMWPVTQRVGTLGSGGQLVSGTFAKVIKTDGTLAKVGEKGELWIKGGQVSPGYYMDEEATREMFVDGWLRTGDEVMFQPNGDLFIVDRIKELIKVKGNQVAPAELEGHLLEHPDVADAGVIGVQDDYSGEVPLAYIVLQPDLAQLVKADQKRAAQAKEALFTHVSTTKSKHKWLTGGIEFIDVLPKSPSGKILRRVLREMAAVKTSPVSAKL